MLCSVLHNGLHILYFVFMRSGTYNLMSLSERMRYPYLSNPKVVRILLDTSHVRLAEYLGCRSPFCPHQRRQTGWTVDRASHALLDGHCITEHNFLSALAHQRHRSPIDRSQRVAP